MVMATIYTIVGEYEKAIDELELVLSMPSWCSAEYLMADPIFAPLNENPRFIALIGKYEKGHRI
jgi:hypothetical protein